MNKEKVVIALGGNAFLQKEQKGTVEEQWENVYSAMKQIADIIEKGYNVILTHGNGPQVGNILEWMDALSDKIPPLSMDIAGAMTQGWIGYMIQQALANELVKRKVNKTVVSVVNQILVSKEDQAFKNPTKYIGPYYNEDTARKLMKTKNWIMKPDPRGGWRRVVSSPDPKDNIEKNAIEKLVNEGFIVVASGGGGIPVIYENNRKIIGVEAVIDKDLASEILASTIKADYFIMLTDVEGAMLNYGKPNAILLEKISAEEAQRYYDMGYFSPGSMGPKVLAAIRFVRNTGKIAVIGHLHKALDTLEGRSGTRIHS